MTCLCPAFSAYLFLTSTTPDSPHHFSSFLTKTQGTASELLWAFCRQPPQKPQCAPPPAPGRKSKRPSRCLRLHLPTLFSPSPVQSCLNMLSPLKCSLPSLGLSFRCSHSSGAFSTITVLLGSRFSPRAHHKPGLPGAMAAHSLSAGFPLPCILECGIGPSLPPTAQLSIHRDNLMNFSSMFGV